MVQCSGLREVALISERAEVLSQRLEYSSGVPPDGCFGQEWIAVMEEHGGCEQAHSSDHMARLLLHPTLLGTECNFAVTHAIGIAAYGVPWSELDSVVIDKGQSRALQSCHPQNLLRQLAGLSH